ncbi:MAG: hypothetical protein KF691_03525 [Phycisphaeraceae bacterium]|nr:hypothetical protein [Phycisphaeraceae bacterium]
MSQEPTDSSTMSATDPQVSNTGADALGAITDFEKSIQGLKKLYEERKEIETRLIDLQSRLVAKETELAQRDRELEQARKNHADADQSLRLLQESVTTKETALQEAEDSLRVLTGELEARKQQEAAKAGEQAQEQEKSKSLAKELDEFASELQKLQSDLDKDKAELAAARESLAEHAKALKDREADLDSRNTEIESEIARRKSELDQRAEELKCAQAAASEAAAADSELARRLTAETEANEQLRSDIERVARRCATQEEVLAEYEELLAVERTHIHEIVSAIQSRDAEPSVTRSKIEELKKCLAHERQERDRLVQRIGELQNAAKSSSAGTAAAGRGATALRQRRLKRCRAILREHVSKVRKASEVLAKRFEQCEQVLAQRAQLAATKRQLEVAGAALARRAASKRAGILTLCTVVTLAVLSGLSWSVVGQAWPGDFAARAEIVADGRGRELSDPELDEWRRSLEATLADPQFVETVASRMKQRGYETLGNAGAVRTLLTTSFSHESPSPGTLSLEIRAPGREKSARMLDIISTALASDANAAREHRADGAVTLIKAPAAAGTQPIDDQRLPRAGMVLLGAVVLTCGLGFGIWGRLSRAKREFELGSQIDEVLDDAKWSEFTASTTVGRPAAAPTK